MTKYTEGTRFAETFCSQCGGSFGPGDSGFSHCVDHQEKQHREGPVSNLLKLMKKRVSQWAVLDYVQGDLVAADCKQMIARLEQLEEVEESARFVFLQMQDIATSDGPPIIQDWGRIDRLARALRLGGQHD